MFAVRAGRARLVAVAGMPRHDRVDVLEEPGADHVDLARSAFFGRRAVVAQRAGMPGRRQPVLHGDRRRERAGAEQVVSAAVAGRAFFDGVARRRLRFLRQPGQRVELADDADDRLAGSERRDERGRDVGDAGLHLKAGGAELLLQQRAALLFLVADLGEAPDLLRDAGVGLAPARRCAGASPRARRPRRLLGGERRRAREKQEQNPNAHTHGT